LLGVHCGTQVNDSGNDGPNVVMEMSAAGRSAYGGNVSNQVIWAWVNAPGLDQPVERIAFINGEARQRQVFHADGLGSIATLTDESGATVQTYTYAAFGSIRTQTGTDLNRITYTAREAMGDSLGFFYYRHRIYDPHTGRFTSEDPLAFVDGANFYIYVGNNPVSFLDPDGLRIKLIGTPQEQAELLAVLQSFIRGTLTSDEEGYVSRAPCGQDEKYESTIDTLITSKNIYYVLFGDATLYGGGYFSPSGFNEGGSIVLSSDIGGTYVGWKGCSLVNDTRTMASVLAHELGHAITHVKKFHHADRRLPSGDPRKQKLENRAWRYSKTPYKRLNKSIPAK
jgi:RHS repeat-associated protein